MEKEKIWYKLAKIYQENVVVATFTALSRVTLKIVNTCAMGAFFVEYTRKTAKDY